MEKVYLTDRAKTILLTLSQNKEPEISESDEKDLILLKEEDFIELEGSKDGMLYPEITDKGIAYVHINPKLTNPSIWQDYKWIITSLIAIIGILVTILIAIITKQ